MVSYSIIVERAYRDMADNSGSPYTTDPVSPRVTTLIEDYDRFDFVDHNEWFCVTAMYVRKD